MTTPGLFSDLVARGLVHDSTDAATLAARLDASPIGVYVGFDPTADSLHVGHLLGQLMLRRFQLAGHRPFPLAGGATGMVGDPSGRSEERNLLDRETLEHNVSRITRQLERILEFGKGSNSAVLVNNADWTLKMGALDFLRDVGKHVTVNQMVAKDSVKSRLASENGLSFTEFSYMLLQANDFRQLCAEHDVEMQMGGSDQWGNITAGLDLIRRTLGRHAHGLTWPLVTRSDGQKFGKTASGAVWLDADKTSPFQFRQFWMQMGDEDALRYLPQYLLRPLEELSALESVHRGAPHERHAQRALADDLCELIHGRAASEAAASAASILFGGDPSTAGEDALRVLADEVPTSRLSTADLNDLYGVLARSGVVASTSEARRTIAQGGVRANGVVLTEENALRSLALLHSRWILLRKGKSTYHLLDLGR